MKVLLTNDDGINAPGLAALHEACCSLGNEISDIHIVAPDKEHSQAGHRITTFSPVQVESLEPQRHSVSGTPADCIRIALTHLLPTKPDLVISGINPGGNMGHDLHISGTVAATREAAYHGVPAVAVSHYRKRDIPLCWETAAKRFSRVLKNLLTQTLEDGAYWNVNLPHLPPDAAEPEIILDCPPERQPLPNAFESTDDGYIYTGDYSQRPHSGKSDVAVCFGGDIAVSKIYI
jgi:5'-nucleotidase